MIHFMSSSKMVPMLKRCNSLLKIRK
jgi:hypothetical protein